MFMAARAVFVSYLAALTITGDMAANSEVCFALMDISSGVLLGVTPAAKPEACSAERTLAIVRMRSLLKYSENCRLEASAREQSRVLALLNRPLISVFLVSFEALPHSVVSYDSSISQGDNEDLF
jgi:hypothetical protein